HCALVSRALGAERMVYTGDQDKKMEKNVRNVVEKWGGGFEIKYRESWKTYLKNFDGKRVYLAMFGLPVQDEIQEIRNYDEDLCIVVGGEKVPGDIYDYIDLQVAVTNQPHSEVAALAVFLDRLQEGEELEKELEGAEIEVVPKEKGKKVEEN
ncbi:MAG: tRNA (cytidine(56)-2'-O)-methyltransferase, partial [Candidatus Aenigmatarchaeota archaeon]